MEYYLRSLYRVECNVLIKKQSDCHQIAFRGINGICSLVMGKFEVTLPGISRLGKMTGKSIIQCVMKESSNLTN